MSQEIQTIVNALEKAIQHSTYELKAPAGVFSSKLEQRIDGEILRAGIQSIINIYKEEPKYLSNDDLAQLVK